MLLKQATSIGLSDQALLEIPKVSMSTFSSLKTVLCWPVMRCMPVLTELNSNDGDH